MFDAVPFSTIVLVGIGILYALSVVNVLREYERGVIFRLGRLLPESKGPGLILVFLAHRPHGADQS